MKPRKITDEQWAHLSENFDCRRRRRHSLREIIDAIFYVVDEGIRWRDLPERFPPWQTVYYYYSKWASDGTLDRIDREYLKLDHPVRSAA